MSFYLEKIHQTYYFRLRVPKDLLPYLGTRQLRTSLKTKNHTTAKALVRGHLYEAEKLFVAIRSGMLTREEITEMVAAFRHDHLERLEKRRRKIGKRAYYPFGLMMEDIKTRGDLQLSTKDINAAVIDTNVAEVERLNDLLQDNVFHEVAPLAQSLLQKHGIQAAPESDDFRLLCEYLLRARIDICNVTIERMKGNYNNFHDVQASPSGVASALPSVPQKPTKLLSELFETYKQVKQAKGSWAQTTLEKNEATFSTIIDILGDLPLSEFVKEETSISLLTCLKTYPRNKNKLRQFMGRKYTSNMAKEAGFVPLSAETIKFTQGLLSTLLKYACKNPDRWGISVNLAGGLVSKDKRNPSEIRSEYTKEDIEGLFRELSKVRRDVEPEKFWIPLTGLYSGARLNEICQLRTADVSEEKGVAIIHIRHHPDLKQQTKSKDSRCFPVHPTLVRLGFLDYVAKVRDQNEARLWPNLREYKGKWEKDMSKWYNRTFKPKFTTDETKVFHSFRHSFINWFKQNALKSADSVENLSIMKGMVGHLENADKGILGHIGGVSLDRYGKAYPTSAQLKLLERLDYGVDLGLLERRR